MTSTSPQPTPLNSIRIQPRQRRRRLKKGRYSRDCANPTGPRIITMTFYEKCNELDGYISTLILIIVPYPQLISNILKDAVIYHTRVNINFYPAPPARNDRT
ncbi:expressed protein [Echinococcus multilocularis]|uniref:Expressed protein n=1 Tax=Echinococcus multilocularis TaxID=6211 RepID=A0A068YDN6_ECHMU|nr:expressed protein [Echinococcus multilocularis]